MAAEWVRWANRKQSFGVNYWEIGNEPEGDWEAGSRLPDGTRLTAEIFAKRFVEFAQAMKAVDPTIKTGGPASSNMELAFGEELIRDAGDQLDFFSLHTYPVEKAAASAQVAMEQGARIAKAVEKIRAWTAKYQPSRRKKLEIGVTEWNYKVVENEETVSMICGLWSSVFIGEMFKAGVDFANQWDLFSTANDGGHALFLRKHNMTPTAQYWALYLWKHYMHDRLLETKAENATNLWSAAVSSSDRLSVMLVNYDRDKDVQVQLDIPGLKANEARRIAFTNAEYTWNPYARVPAWSRQPRVERLNSVAAAAKTTVPPMSIQVVEFRTGGKAFEASAEKPPAQAKLQVCLPEKSAVDLPVEGLLLLRDDARGGGAIGNAEATLKVTGPAELLRDKVRLNEGSVRFTLKLKEPGEVKVTATAGKLSAEASMKSLKVEERDEVYWRFDGAPETWGLKSTYTLRASDQAMPNQNVAMVQLESASASQNKDLILHAEQLPSQVLRDRLGGVVFKMKRSPEFDSGGKPCAIGVVLQSEANHWIPVARINLSELGADWKAFRFPLQNPADILAMPLAYSLRLQLLSEAPVTGKLYIDDLGFILRGAGN
jgi:hypothetical protein